MCKATNREKWVEHFDTLHTFTLCQDFFNLMSEDKPLAK